MELPQLALEHLKILTDKTGATSYAEVTKNAYRLYSMLIEMYEKRCSLMIKKPDGEIKEIQLFL